MILSIDNKKGGAMERDLELENGIDTETEAVFDAGKIVITSYSIHYTKLYDAIFVFIN